MTKYFCDRCQKELKNKDHNRIKRHLGDHTVEVLTAFKNVWNSGHICHKCIEEVIMNGKDCK